MERHLRVEVLASETVFEGSIFDVVVESVRLPSGLRQDVAVVDHRGAVCVAPLLDDGRLLLVEQYRHAAGDWMLEIPAGRLEEGESPEDAVRRELEEETGHRASHVEKLYEYLPAPGFCSERITLFVARGLEAVEGGGLACDEDEELALVRLTPEEILAPGACQDVKTLLAAALLVGGRLAR